jgi:DNA-binding MarR family transcriptional regulator
MGRELHHGAAYADDAMHPGQIRLLGMIAKRDRTPKEIAERLDVAMPTVSKRLAVLERNGWLERGRDAEDRRRVVVSLTDEGRACLKKAHGTVEKHLASLMKRLGDEDLRALEQGLEALRDALDEASPDDACERT